MKTITTMMILVTVSLLVALHLPAFGTEPPIRMKYLSTDYKGIQSNGTSVLCYGTNGVMTRSTDKGATWERVDFNRGETILALDTLQGEYIGLTENTLIHSQDDGITWKTFPLTEGIDLTHFKDTLVILTRTTLLMCTPSTLANPRLLTSLDTMKGYEELICSADGDMIHWIEDNTSVGSYTRSIQRFQSKDLRNQFTICPTCHQIRHLQRRDSIIYVAMTDNQAIYGSPNVEYYYIMKSLDHGNTWSFFAPKLFNDFSAKSNVNRMSNLLIINDSQALTLQCEPYILSANPTNDTSVISWKTYQIAKYTMFDTSGEVSILNPADTLPKISTPYYSKTINQLLRLDTNVLIGVGPNNYIVRSSTNGRTWEIESCFSVTSPQFQRYFSLNPSTLFVASSGTMYRTTNSGVTFRSQDFAFYPQYVWADDVFCHYDTTGKGCVILETGKESDTNVFITEDFGKTYRPFYNLEYYHKIGNSGKLANSRKQEIVQTDSTFLLFGSPLCEPLYNPCGYSIVIRLRKKDYTLLDTVRIPTQSILSMIADGNTVYLVGMNGEVQEKRTADEVVIPTYALYRSTNQGTSWDSLPIRLPTDRTIVKTSTNRFRAMYQAFNPPILVQNRIVFYLDSNTLMVYDIAQQQCDTMELRHSLAGGFFSERALCEYQGGILGNWRRQLVFTRAKSPLSLWDTVSYDKVLDWQYEYMYNLYGFVKNTSDTGFALINSQHPISRSTTRLQLAQFIPTQPRATSIDNVVNNQAKTYVWSTLPHPQPTRGVIATELYWDFGYGVNDAKIMITDIMGTKIDIRDISFDAMSSNSARLSVNMSGYATGVYFIVVRIGSGTRVIPISVISN